MTHLLDWVGDRRGQDDRTKKHRDEIHRREPFKMDRGGTQSRLMRVKEKNN